MSDCSSCRVTEKYELKITEIHKAYKDIIQQFQGEHKNCSNCESYKKMLDISFTLIDKLQAELKVEDLKTQGEFKNHDTKTELLFRQVNNLRKEIDDLTLVIKTYIYPDPPKSFEPTEYEVKCTESDGVSCE